MERSAFAIVATVVMVMVMMRVEGSIIGYDARGLLFDKQPKLLFSGSIHYPRSTPEMWESLISNAKEGGLDVVQTYVFWNAHEPEEGKYNFEGNLDLLKFLNLVKEAGLYVNLRIGPFINAEWNFGGLPVWLYLQDNVGMRTNNTIFMKAMQDFTTKIVQMMKDQNMFSWQGGPIIMAQIENEFGAYKKDTSAYAYAMWAANMAIGLNTSVPWIMCKQPDAPDPVVNTHNGVTNGDIFQPNAPYKPKMWTELYTGWFQTYKKPKPFRPAANIAFEVARFFMSNGSFVNYYMYHGGTNFGRTGGGPFMATTYDYDAPIDEYGLLNQPKWGHLRALHQALKLCEATLINRTTSDLIALGRHQNALVLANGTENCAAFLSNLNARRGATVEFNGYTYNLPAQSISILPDCKTVAFNTAQVSTQTNTMQMVPAVSSSLETTVGKNFSSVLWNPSWNWYSEPIGVWGETYKTSECCLEQIRMTKDSTDYLWYITSIDITDNEDVGNATLHISSVAHAAHLYVNGHYAVTAAGDRDNPYVEIDQPLELKNGKNEIAILSMTVGLQSGVQPSHIQHVGIQGPVILNGLSGGALNLSSQFWTYQVGLQGEFLQLHTRNGSNNVDWSISSPPQNRSLIWYKTMFDAPASNSPLALDLETMGKGEAWVNGKSIGRYWPSCQASGERCSLGCGAREKRCYSGCGQSSQRWYHVPLAWIKPTGNLLVLLEEMGGDPMGITLVTRSLATICSSISEDYPAPLDSWQANSTLKLPELKLECDAGQQISSIVFASYGTPRGNCSKFRKGPCHAEITTKIVKQACVGRRTCTLQVTSSTFGNDPCPIQIKALAVIASCSWNPSLTR
ncbi:hypothetical protein GOP47_0014947 [Adiantum capillus-veneris]|uniref:Beta-galactosidase n=1 Tax=Adiantum capillus-veneris TaxID=13818 RepID=A0A9D4UN14_ADICA|nr:hypothetical protein GOP47_0014947 [Adiantum capillus-veneris]